MWSDGYRENDPGAGYGFFRCHACKLLCDKSVLEGEEWESGELAVPAFLRNLGKKVPAQPGEVREGDHIGGLELARTILADPRLSQRHAEMANSKLVDHYWHKAGSAERVGMRKEYESARDALAALLKKGGESALKLAELYRSHCCTITQ